MRAEGATVYTMYSVNAMICILRIVHKGRESKIYE